jgi:signal transduction histidine kinase
MSRATVLLVDDEEGIRRICIDALREAHYNVIEARTGFEAIETARHKSPGALDLLVTDLRMPDIDGLQVAQEIRCYYPDLLIVVMTGYGTLDAALQALKEGVSEFVLKPFRPDELVDAVARALHTRRLERENVRLQTLLPLFDLSRLLMSTPDLQAISRHVVHTAREEMRADSASLMLLDAQGKLTIRAAEGLPPEVILKTHQSADEGIAGHVLTHREPLVLQGDLTDDPRFASVSHQSGVRSAISLPLIHQDRALGVLNVSRREEALPFTEGDVEFLAVLASQAAVALENARLFQESQDAYRRLAELDHLKSEFISIASHELRSPLAVLLAYATLSEAEATGPVLDHLHQVRDSAMQLKAIIDEMVSLRRIDTGEAQIHLSDVAIAGVVSDVLQEFLPLASQEGIDLITEIPDGLIAARADEQVVRLILSNLLSNAIKFTQAEGRVTILAYQEEDRVILAVEDTGIGIPEEELEQIFARFYQVEDSLRREHGGIGLGLAIAREMAELIDSTLSVSSRIGRGSIFSLSLPGAQ